MAYRFEFDSKHRVLVVRFSENVSSERITEFYNKATREIERIQPRAAIFDFTEVTSFDVSSVAVRALADAPPLVSDSACPRLVVAPAKHIYAMSRMFQLWGERSRPALSVHRSINEALAEIAIDPVDFQPLPFE